MLLGAAGLRTHIWNNNLRSIILLAGFPLLLVLIGYALTLVWMGLSGDDLPAVKVVGAPAADVGGRMANAADHLPQIGVISLALAAVWFVIAWFFHQRMINAATGARPVSRQDETELYNLLENLAISRGLPMPRLAIIETGAMNAYASGITEKSYTVTVTRGLMDALNKDELEAVLAHELSHIRHGDVRMLVIAVIFVGIISFIAEIGFRVLIRSGGGGRRSGGVLILIAAGLIVIAYILAILIRFSLSRRREYMADAGAVELTKNPDAMISALLKISGQTEIEKAPSEIREMMIDNPRSGFMGVFATHPPIEKRVDMLVEHAGGRRPEDIAPPHPTVPQR
ncbi:M48 family metallopeptidase [Maricaulis sp.]|uniref:M48 family metallopeptidase n=1 Tax=Maricaulis sp. TaxID=1486257 RepID=UPI00260FD138|nr:M48 family metallopeptidase [Maricaulis sp.]